MELLSAVGLFFFWYLAFIVSTTFHEAAHAYAAMKLGDPTAYHGGQVTLNPLPHMQREPFGTILVPILSYALGGWIFGWASAPYDPDWAMRHPHSAAKMALAGPLANLLLLVLAGLLIRGGILCGIFDFPHQLTTTEVTIAQSDFPPAQNFARLVSIFFSLNLLLFVFNLLPLPPLDGSSVIMLFMSENAAARWQETLRSQPMLSAIGLIIAWRGFTIVFKPLHLIAVNLLYPDVGYH